MGNNIIGLKKIVINVAGRIILISSYNITIDVKPR